MEIFGVNVIALLIGIAIGYFLVPALRARLGV